MKRIIAVIMLIGILAVMLVNTSAADEKINVMTNAVKGTDSGLLSQGKHAPANMWDGITTYNGDISATFCDFKWAASKSDAMSETVTKYNINGETGKEDSIYFYTFEIILDKLYTVDTLRFYAQTYGSAASLDGFDLWLSETGLENSYKKVVSATELVCDQKYEKSVTDGVETACYSEEFDATKVQYIIFGLTQYRCQHTDKLTALGIEANANPHYFRITEIELFGTAADGGAATTTAPVVTTEAPAVTEAPTTEAPATEAPATEAPATEAPATEAPATAAPSTDAPVTDAPEEKGGCGSSVTMLGTAVLLAGAVFVTARKKKD